MHFGRSALNCTPSYFDRLKDVQSCSASTAEFAPTAFLVLLLLFSRFPKKLNAMLTRPKARGHFRFWR